MLTTDDGKPLAPVYAATLKESGALPVGATIHSTQSEFTVHGAFRWLRVYLSALPIHCRMQGHPWDDDFLESLVGVWYQLPYAPKVIAAIVDQADFLDRSPEYRGLPGVANRDKSAPAQSVAEDAPTSLRGKAALGG